MQGGLFQKQQREKGKHPAGHAQLFLGYVFIFQIICYE